MTVHLIGTLDTKGQELAFVRNRLETHGIGTCLIDAGCLGEPSVIPDVTHEDVFTAAGTTLEKVRAAGDRGSAVTLAAQGVTAIISAKAAKGEVSGVLGIGGSAGTTIATAAMRALPLGVPKLMVSTLASGNVRPYVGDKDIMMLNSIVDIAGLNLISREVLSNAARAMAGMVTFAIHETIAGRPDRPLVAATMFGVTTPCVEQARQLLEAAGYEVLVFHATGNGGQAMESLIRDGVISGVLDITTTELADELVGGTLSAGPERLTAAGKSGVPQVISVGALDMVNFGPRNTVPERFADRKFHVHNANVTLMRTTVEENRKLGEEIGRKAAAAKGPVSILFPRRGVSAIDQKGQPFDDPDARTALHDGLKATCGKCELIAFDCHINETEFAVAAANKLLDLMARRRH